MSDEQQRNEPEAGQPETISVPRQANAETGGEAARRDAARAS